MGKIKKHKYGFLKVLIFSFLLAFLAILFFDKIVTFVINNCTAYRVTYAQWGDSIFRRSKIKELEIHGKDGKFDVYVKEMRINVTSLVLFKNPQLEFFCKMSGVKFISNETSILPPGDRVLAFSFESGRTYENISFNTLINRKLFKITGFKADSKNIKIEGNYTFDKVPSNVFLGVKLSFSPEIITAMDDNFIKKGMLSLEDDGWYSASIEYNGNHELLKAMYDFVLPD
ncbi:MAG: hypothetical protein ABIH85_01770 [Candidatus Omnitrophota bacterium]|nr:hypothetical protein [Candidatus Omnitrophota bacterium]MBU1894791.1 hypothetical protein [Candidatus Omnitrophota bacterium]